jgi:hypothetical protein
MILMPEQSLFIFVFFLIFPQLFHIIRIKFVQKCIAGIDKSDTTKNQININQMKQILKNTLIVVVPWTIVNECFAQDRIILSSGDTIHCTISKVTKNYLYFRQDYNGISAKGKILKSNIREWNYFIAKMKLSHFLLNLKYMCMDSEKEPDFVLNQSGRAVPDFIECRACISGGKHGKCRTIITGKGSECR